MKRLKHIISGIVWTLVGLYLLVIVLLHIPAVQAQIGAMVGNAIAGKFGTKVSIGRVDLGFLNRLIIDDVMMYDHDDKQMLRAARVSAKIDYYPLMHGRISISSAQLFGMQANLYKKDAVSAPNYQFVLDSLASKDTTRHTPIDMCINSLIIRHGEIQYDRYDKPLQKSRFDMNHLKVQDISAHIMLPRFTDDSIDLMLKKLSMRERSGIHLQNLSFHMKAGKDALSVKDFNVKLPHSDITIDSLQIANEDLSPIYAQGKFRMEHPVINGYISKTKITPSELASFEPRIQSFNDPLYLTVSVKGTPQDMHIGNLHIASADNGVELIADGQYQHSQQTMWLANIQKLKVNANTIADASEKLQGKGIPTVVTRMGNILFNGEVGQNAQGLYLNGNLHTDAGSTTLTATKQDRRFTGHIDTKNLDLQRLLDNDRFGQIATDIRIEGTQQDKGIPNLKAQGVVSLFDYNGYRYHDINIDGSYSDNTFNGMITMNDENGKADINGTFVLDGQAPMAKLTASISHFAPKALRLTDYWGDAAFEADIIADIQGKDINTISGTADILNLSMSTPATENTSADYYQLNRLHLDAGNRNQKHYIQVESDFGQARIEGEYDYGTLAQSITNVIGSKLPTLPGLPPTTNVRHNNFTILADIKQSDWLRAFFRIPLSIYEPVHLEGNVNDDTNSIDLLAQMPSFYYDDSYYENGIIKLNTSSVGELLASGHINKLMDNGHKLSLNLNANAANNQLVTSLNWSNNEERPIKGTFNSTTEFFKAEDGKDAAHVRIHPSEILINDTAWHVQPSDIVYSDKHLVVDYFAIEHNKQHIIVSGMATESANDSLLIDLQGFDVAYILNLVNFHAVDFDGYATGTASVKSAFNTPEAYADLTVDDFQFEHGRMGTLTAHAAWNNKEKQIDIDARADDEHNAVTLIKGYVSPSRHFIDLGITAHDTRLEFMQSFCSSFLDNVDAHGNGELRLAGDLSEINLTGMVVANGEVDVTTLNTHYTMKNDTVRMIPNEIIFHQDTIRDRHGNIGILNGALHHQHLTRLTYDLRVDAQNLLCYDFHDYGDNIFFGTVYGIGDCTIRGRSGRIDFDINVTPQKGSFIEYNAASPDALTDQEFITWRDRSKLEAAIREKNDESISRQTSSFPAQLPDIESDIHMNFMINVTPDATLRLLMDQASGDYIALNGSGAIQASFYNKGSFDMFGTYLVDHGIYKLTIQNVIKKDFQFQQGGTIVFGGDPYHAALNLQALYTVNGVPLSDLQIGRSFSSNNVRVDCMMNIGGTPEAPHVDFDLDLPTVNTDAKQMVRSIINSEEEMNQQVIYLLSIGRFYSQNANNADENQSQASLAMQSLLSGTISQQINSVLSSLVNSSNWNFGANISTGDEGFNNAEYEGLLSGRLLNNRLLINGQFGYRDNANATTSFIGDFDIRYLLYPNGNLSIKVYNQTNDRYFTRNSLTTQGIGLLMKRDFNSWRELFRGGRKRKSVKNP